MAEALATSPQVGPIARPLHVLVPLIHDDLKHGREAARQAVMPYYQAAGEKLLEAKDQMRHGEFIDWIKRHFTLSVATAYRYMQFAEHVRISNNAKFENLTDFIRKTRNPNYNRPVSWHQHVKEVLNRVDTETLNLKRDKLTYIDARAAERALAVRLINIGYKALACTLHPDKGGSREAMVRLNAVRARLKQHA